MNKEELLKKLRPKKTKETIYFENCQKQEEFIKEFGEIKGREKFHEWLKNNPTKIIL